MNISIPLMLIHTLDDATLGQIVRDYVAELSPDAIGAWAKRLTGEQLTALFEDPSAVKPAAKAKPTNTAKQAKPPRTARPRAIKAVSDADKATVLAYVRANPSRSAQKVAQFTGLDPAVVKPALAALVASGAITSSGKARGTVYLATYANGAGADA